MVKYKKIANIVSDVNISDKVEVNIETINFLTYKDKINTELPTLYVGYNKIKTICPDINILNKNITDNKLWCFSKDEKLLGFYSLLRKYENIYPKLYFDSYKIINVNPYYNDLSFKDLIISTNFDKIYLNNESLYLLTFDKIIYTFDLKLYDFVFDDYFKIIKKYLQKYHLNILIEDYNKKILEDLKSLYPLYKDIIEKYIVTIYV